MKRHLFTAKNHLFVAIVSSALVIAAIGGDISAFHW